MMKKKQYFRMAFMLLLAGLATTACNDDDVTADGTDNSTGTSELPDWYYTGGELGTTFVTTQTAYEQPTPAVDANSTMTTSFNRGEQLFEKPFNSNFSGTRYGLGPVYIRTSCMHCHPGYGHGKSQSEGVFRTSQTGNGYLLVVYNPETNAYVTWLSGMPQGHAVDPFKAPLDESQITLSWHEYTDQWGNEFPDGETYSLRYPEVTLPPTAVYVYNKGYDIGNYEVRLESTIGIYGTGLLDAITDDDLKAQYAQEEADGYLKNGLNTSIFANGEWTGQYSNTTQGDGTKYPYRYTYALSRGPLQDAAGANAFWNITNVTRSDRRYHYLDNAGTYALYSSQDADVQAGFRTYIEQADTDGQGTTLAVSYDPWGIGLTYAGYGLLLLSMILFFSDPHSRYRKLLHHPLLRRGAVCLAFGLAGATGVQAANAPRALPRETAEAFGRLYVYYNDRICPLQTLAKDFTVKLCGHSTYKGLTPEQVLTGWFFYYDNWKEEPCIRIRSKEVQHLLGIEGSYARLIDFVGRDGYKLGEALREGTAVTDTRGASEANEKFSLISQVATGSIWKLYPYAEAGDSSAAVKRLAWYSLTDRHPAGMPVEQTRFVRSCMNYVGEQVARRDFRRVEELVGKLRKYQVREAQGFLPSDTRIAAERCYNRLNNSRPLAMTSLTLGLLAFVAYCHCMVRKRQMPRLVTRTLAVLLGGLFLFLCFLLVLRGMVGGYLPMSNGHETMQLMAACTALLTCCLHRKLPIALSFGFLLSGLALLVSMMGEANPPITPLMPVLSSPLLSLHVMVIMAAYTLLAFLMLNGVTALTVRATRKDWREEAERLQLLGEVLLYPAVFLLATGIFVGAVWANVSWGSYWSWDPKEV